MKKKFFTLLAAALFGTSAFAQVAPGSVATTLNQGGLYHVGDGTNYRINPKSRLVNVYAKMVLSLNMKKGISLTPLN